ncbi:hypothetical protein [Citrobacter koseri]|uniref:hypothetical protein n=1 Tax=Citrobacter koseri TaxID=545 RepID=UPI0019040ED6|nr:hypothetical protein [Citrobacter koseri]MBJ8812672.1 hypothetical protein [Citrobacter koseri]
MSEKENPTFKSDSKVILAADAALAAASQEFKEEGDLWFRQKLIKAALETALASIIVL